MTLPPETYRLDDQIGYLLRRVTQRHLALFSETIPALTTMQFAVLARLSEHGSLSQNSLGRAAAMDAATVKGVVDRLARQGLVALSPDPTDRRRLIVELSADGRAAFSDTWQRALEVSEATLAPIDPDERATLLALLARLT